MTLRTVVITATLLAAVFALGWWLGGANHAPAPSRSTPSQASGEAQGSAGDGPSDKAGKEREILYWVAPMDSSFRRDKPGKSPMGMDLVPVYADEADDSGGVRVDSGLTQSIGIRTAEARLARLRPEARMPGRVVADERRREQITVRAAAWVEALHVRALGTPVKRGEALFDIYAPDMVAAQSEYLQARTRGDAARRAARARLEGLGLGEREIAALDRRGTASARITVHAPRAGTLTTLNAREGAPLKADRVAAEITGFDRLWLMADSPPHIAARARPGAVALFDSRQMPALARRVVLDHIYPTLDPVSRTRPLRFELDNEDGRLGPGMVGRVRLTLPPLEESVVVPNAAVISLGDSDHVILALDDNRFRPAQVRPGALVNGERQILAGLNAGERVVVSGQFLLDSETGFRNAERRMIGGEAP
ncbi:efflux RND transporter periplasmic adaptor subunit [Yunchengibacter salinarum]|uniref:efflux RND transporter periplasmic adaptor subunit n=1 Tax=Yunchengibacter salinarum TaxID=3133399 RepID=UPI0035B69A42